MIGFSAEACLSALGGTLDPLLDVIKKGTLKGVVALVSCTTLRDGGQDINTLKQNRKQVPDSGRFANCSRSPLYLALAHAQIREELPFL